MATKTTGKPTPAWEWIVCGIASIIVGGTVSWFIVTFDIPLGGRGGVWFMLVPGGVVMLVYGLFAALRNRIRAKR
jgi:hypothetical protein